MPNIKKFFQSYWPQIFITLLGLVLFSTNFESGKYLLGWDNTTPELNLPLNLKRNIFGIWQEYRGLGTLDGMAHTANLVHWFYAWALSVFLPQNFIRWVINIALHSLGGVGMYLLVKDYVLPEVSENLKKKSSITPKLISLLSAVFYQFNMMTSQMFYIPLEVFSIHFAAIPWGLLALFKYLRKPIAKNLLWLGLINVAFISQAHVPSVFISYAILNAIFLFYFLIKAPRNKWKEFVSVVLLLFAINSFWGLPYIYSAIQKAPEISQAKINLLSTDEIFLRNQAWGNLKSVATFGGFNLDYHDWNQDTGKFELMMGEWLETYDDELQQLVSMAIFSLAVLGFLLTLLKSKKFGNTILLPSALAWLFFFTMLANDTPFVKNIPQLFRDYIPFFHDIFRFALTKFSLIFVAMTAIQLSIALGFLTSKLNHKKLKAIGSLVIIVLLITQLWNFRQAFNGHFFYHRLKVEIPEEYQDLKRYLSSQPSYSRIAFLPVSSPYGWTTYSWGYRGSGFVWQMIPQPSLDRAFDAWSKENEEFYLQFYRAQKNNDIDAISDLLSKYQVTYILLDKNIITPDSGDDEKYLENLRQILTNNLLASKVWANQGLTLYKLNDPFRDEVLPIFEVKNPEIISSNHNYSRLPINIFPDYIKIGSDEMSSLSPNKFFPFSNLSQEVVNNVTYQDDGVTITSEVPDNFDQSVSEIEIPGLPTGLPIAPIVNVSLVNQNLTLLFNKPMNFSYGDQSFDFPELNDINLELSEIGPEIYVSVNGQIFEVAADNQIEVQLLNLLPNREIELLVFDKTDAIQEDDETLLSENDAQRFRVESNYWDNTFNSRYLPLPEEGVEEISLFIPTISQENTLEALRDTKPINCDVFKRGEVEKNHQNTYIEYRAGDRGAACESFGLFHVDTSLSHLLRVEGENISGRNLKIFLANKASNQLDLEYLMQDKLFDTTFPILSWPNLENSYYNINHESRSFGNEYSINNLSSIKVYTLPVSINYLTNIVVQNQSKSNFSGGEFFQLKSLTKNNIAQYQAKVILGANSRQVIALNQSFDPGWIAWSIQGRTLLEHHRLNDWSNAWILENNSDQDQELDIIIFYWPQLLVFAGYGIATATLVYLAFKSRQK